MLQKYWIHILRRVRLALLLLVVGWSVAGCATYLIKSYNKPITTSDTKREWLYDDTLVGLGVVPLTNATDAHHRENLKRAHVLLGEKNSSDLKRAYVLLGEKNSYVVQPESGAVIEGVMRRLDGQFIRLVNLGSAGSDAIDVHVLENADDARFSSHFQLNYLKPVVELSSAEKENLSLLGFKFDESAGSYRRNLYMQGFIYPPANNLHAVQSTFKKQRLIKVTLVTTTFEEWEKPLQILLPLGVAFDVLTAPLQFLLFENVR